MTPIEQANRLIQADKKILEISEKHQAIIELINNALIKCEGQMALIDSEFFCE